MQSFKIRPDGFKEIRKKMLLVMIPGFLVIIIIIVTNTVGTGTLTGNGSASTYQFVWSNDLILPLAIIVLSFGAVFFSMYRFYSRIKKMYDSYELQISDNLIAREQLNTPTISIYLRDVQEIVKRKKGTFIVKGTAAHDLIIIPAQIENYNQLEMALEQIKPIATKSQKATPYKIQALLSLVSVGLIVCINLVNNKIIVAIAGILFAGIMVWNFIQTQKSKNVDYRTKRFKWFGLIVVIAIIYVVIQKLTSPEMP